MTKKSNNLFVSIIVTTYNRKVLLKETIDSILNQSFKNFELIVVDNYSNYDFISLIKSFNDNRIRPFQNENNGIIAVNRNYGIKKAKGDYLAFCDDDDLWMPEKLEKQLKLFDRSEVIGAGTYLKLFGETQLFRNKRNNDLYKVEYYSFRDILINHKSVPLSSLMVRANEIRFSEDKKFNYVEDWDYQLQLTYNDKKIAQLTKSLIKYRKPALTEKYPHKSFNTINVINKYKTFYSKSEYYDAISHYNWFLGLNYLKTDQFMKARHYFNKSYKWKKSVKTLGTLIISKLPNIVQKLAVKFYYILFFR